MTQRMKDITVTTATIDFGDWKISATGVLGESYDWRIETKLTDWKSREYFSDEEELEEFLWSEVQRLNQKYSVCVFEHEIEQVEDEDYFEED